MARKPYTWSKVKNGDIISFHYETKRGPDKGRKLLRTILVINKLFRKNKVGGDVSRLLSGILLKKSASAVARPELVKTIIDSFGEIQLREAISGTRVILSVSPDFNADTPQRVRDILQKLSRKMGRVGGTPYRTFDYDECLTSAVHLEPIQMPLKVVEGLKDQIEK